MPTLISVVRSALGRLIQWEEERVDVEEESISPDEDVPEEVDFGDIVADFAEDDDEDDDKEDDSGDNAKGDTETEWTSSVMYIYMEAIQKRLRFEIKNCQNMPPHHQFLLNEISNHTIFDRTKRVLNVILLPDV